MIVTLLACASVPLLSFATGWLWRDTNGGLGR
jgi:hypothetical protein